MGTLFYYVGNPELEALSEEALNLFSATFVYQAPTMSGGQVGFDADSTGENCAYAISSGGLHSNIQTGEFFFLPSVARELVHAVRKWPTVTILAENQQLVEINDAVIKYRSAERHNVVRKRRGKELKPAPDRPAALDLLGDDGRCLITPIAQQLFDSGVQAVVKWRRTDFGLHCYYVSPDSSTTTTLAAELTLQQNLKVVHVESEHDIPVR